MFSIIMPAYNAEKFIEASIESVLAQTFADYELLIINDCSTDNTVDIIQKCQYLDSRIKLLHNERNSGVAMTRNHGIEYAQYPYICFLDSDDLWTPDKLQKYLKEFEEGNNVIYSFYTRFNQDGNLNLVKTPLVITYHELLKGNCIGNLTGAYNSKTLGKFYQKKIKHEDYVMWLEILKQAGSAVCIPENLAFYRVSDQSLSSNKLKSLLWTWNIYYQELELGFMYSSYLMINSALRAVFKRF